MTPFTAVVTKDERVLIAREGRTIVTVAGQPAERLARSLATAADEPARQLLLARATGNYKRGNER
jgi:hypothetical protein